MGQCGWDTNYSLTPVSLECVVRFCDNATQIPNTDGNNYNMTFTGLVSVGASLTYPCADNHRLEDDVDWKDEARGNVSVLCGEDGEFDYPAWSKCSDTVFCPDPGNSTEVSRQYSWTPSRDLEYGTTLVYRCDDKRKWIRLASQTDSELTETRSTTCHWRGSYDMDGTQLVCVIHHCRHPHNDPGLHQPPPPENNLLLTNLQDWNVPFSSSVTYHCAPGEWFEDDSRVEPGEASLDVPCLSVGEYNTPPRQGRLWPNCTSTVLCPPPPPPPVNGSRAWVLPAQEDQQTFNTSLEFRCEDGQQFDTDNDGLGDQLTFNIRQVLSLLEDLGKVSKISPP